MSGRLVDDYLSQLLGAVSVPPADAAPAPPATPAPATPALPTSAAADAISDDEFEALLDALHGTAAPGAVPPATPAAAATATPALPTSAAADAISDDEFEALLDALHGGAAPGAVAVAAAPAPKPVPLAAVAAAPARPTAYSAAAAVALTAARDSATVDGDRREADEGPWRGEERRGNRRSSRWLRLRVHAQDYGVELLKVQEVLLPVPVLPMRDTEAAILGVMNLRGVVVPVLDLGVWLGLEEVPDAAQTRYVVLEQNGDCLALKVSAVLDVHAIGVHQIEPAEHTLAAPAGSTLRGVTRLNSQPVILLDAAALLG